METLRNEAVIYTFTKERQSLEDVIAMSNVGGEVGDRLRKSLRYKFDMLCHTKVIDQNEMIEEINDGDLLDVSYFFT